MIGRGHGRAVSGIVHVLQGVTKFELRFSEEIWVSMNCEEVAYRLLSHTFLWYSRFSSPDGSQQRHLPSLSWMNSKRPLAIFNFGTTPSFPLLPEAHVSPCPGPLCSLSPTVNPPRHPALLSLPRATQNVPERSAWRKDSPAYPGRTPSPKNRAQTRHQMGRVDRNSLPQPHTVRTSLGKMPF